MFDSKAEFSHPFMRGLFGHSGGVFYHARALRYRGSWRGFREALRCALEQWKPRHAKLILIGPSAGHCLDTTWLRRFEAITAIDLDPSAPLLFRMRHPDVSVDWQRGDAFFKLGGIGDLEHTATMLREFADHAILFCNVLGQLPVVYRGQFAANPEVRKRYRDWQWNFIAMLNQRGSWCSFHDLAHSRYAPARTDPYVVGAETPIEAASLINHFYADLDSVPLSWHGWKNRFQRFDRRVLHWQLDPWRHHFVEFVVDDVW